MRRVAALLGLLMISAIAHGQDTLKVMSWNVLNYSGGAKDQYYRTVLRHVRPDVLVVQEMTSQAGVDNFLSNVVNPVFPGEFAKGIFIDGPDTDNAIYYRTAKWTFVSNTAIHTVLRNISEFKLYSVAAADTFRIYSVHLKASTGFEANRAAEVDSLRKVTNALPSGKYFMVCGDYNIYTSTEPAYQKLLQDNLTDDGHFVDALSLPGTWNTASYAPYHTQSTRIVQLPDGGSTGGLDDRFDMILYSRAVSQPGKIQYVTGSLTPVGNDGLHYNDGIDHLPNNAVPDSVAIALYNASDHLPVSARFVASGGTVISPEPTVQASNVVITSVTSNSMRVGWTNGNGAKRIVIARAGGAVSFTPVDGQSYLADTNFALATDLGSGNKAVFSGSGSAMTVEGLSANTTYYYAVYEFNGSGGTENYLSASPATGSQTTLSATFATYYSQGSFAPNLVSSWNSERGGSGSQPPDFASGASFVIQGGHTMVSTAPWTVSGTGNRVEIESGGTLQADQLISTAAFQINNGGSYVHNAVNGANGATTDIPGSVTRSFGASSTIEIRKWGDGTGTSLATLPAGVTWGNLTINIAGSMASSWQQLGGVTTISGNLSILSTGLTTREFRLSANTPYTLTVGGDLTISGGILNLTNGSGTAVSPMDLTIGGSFSQTGGTMTQNATNHVSVIRFTGSGKTFSQTGGTLTSTRINWIVPSGASIVLNSDLAVASGRSITVNGALNCGSNAISGPGAVTVASGSTLILRSTDGIDAGTSLGNIRVSGVRTFDAGASYVVNGTAAQSTGNGFPASVNHLTIDNSSGVVLTGSVTVNGTLTLANGVLSLGTTTMTLNGDIAQTNGTLGGGPSSGITIGGSGGHTLLPTVSLGNLSVQRTAGISLAGPLTVSGALTVTTGSVTTGGYAISLGPVATLSEPADLPIDGTVTTTRTISQSVNNTFGGLGVEVNATGASPGSTVVSRQTNAASVWNGSQSILRYFDLSPATNGGLDATLVFHYSVSELNGHNGAALSLWRSTDAGASWELAGGTVDTTARTITVSGVSSFSRWTAADNLHFPTGTVTSVCQMSEGWNMVSVPLDVADYRKVSVFPTSTSDAFAFDQASGYVVRDTLKNGTGYWLKFPSTQSVNIVGSARNQDTVSVSAGWNMIGSTTVPVAVTSIRREPAEMVAGSFFDYRGAYAVADSIRPGSGYWVKVDRNGRLILR